MPYKDPEKAIECRKRWNERNKEHLKEKRIEWKEKNKELLKEKGIEYREKNKEKIKEYQKEYNQTEGAKKSFKINNWKRIGVKSDDYSSLYDYYLNCKNCERCGIDLVEGKGMTNHKHLDHDHKTGLFRNVLCGYCNVNLKE